jgi:aminoglycoside/choline kinase family phosphotransferase
VLLDPYVTLTAAERDELLSFYLATMEALGHKPAADFRQTFELCAMQRLMQALGAYGFLGIVKEREHFLQHIPAALVNLKQVLERITGLERLSALLAKLPVS